MEDIQNKITHENIIEAEKLILGVALHSTNAIPDIMNRLVVDDFLESRNKLIFEGIINLNLDSKPINSVTLVEKLNDDKKLDKAGGLEYISEISLTYYTDENIDEFIDIVYKSSAGRKLDKALSDIQRLRKEKNNLDDILMEAQKQLLNIDLEAKKFDIKSIGKSMNEVIEKIKDLEQREDFLTGVSTGYSRLDKITSGLQKGDFIILAARPSMGKTAFALNVAQNAALNNKQTNSIALFSIEMPSEQLTQRMLSNLTQIESNKLRTGKGLNQKDWESIHKANDRLQKTNIYIDDTPGITIQQIQSKLYKLKRDHNVNLCIIDYLQLISTPGSSGIDRQNEISNISRQLKKIARDTGIPIICLSQLSRSVEKREDKRPIMSDLRDSGAIEQDADVIIFLYRKEYYDNVSHDQQEINPIHDTELIISKHRNGATGIVNLSFNLKFGKFVDIN